MANGPTNAALTLQPGAMISPTLRLVRPLAVGGMGSVWVADHLAFRTHVVVKFMSEALASNADALARFSREAAAASQVKSPHVVHMIEHGVTNAGVPFIAMEMLDGRDLRHLLDERRTLEPELVSNVVSQVARALMAANQRGIVHRDIKPENIFLTDAGGGDLFVKVLDFGIAKATTGEMSRSTGTGAMLGTPSYMSPEQILGQKTIDFRSDLWALGIVAYEALTGSVPFDGETVGAISVAICSGQAPAMSQRAPQLGPAFDAWFARACAREPSHRFSSAKEMADALAVTVSGFGDEATTLLARPLHSGALDADASSRVQVPITNVSLPAVPTTTPSSARQLTTGGASSTTTAQADGASVARPKRFAILLSGGIGLGAILGLVLFTVLREPEAPAVFEAGGHSHKKSTAGSGALKKPAAEDEPSVTPTTAPSPSVSGAASASASASNTSERTTPTARLTPTTAPRPTSAPPAVTATTTPTKPATKPTRTKASDVILE